MLLMINKQYILSVSHMQVVTFTIHTQRSNMTKSNNPTTPRRSGHESSKCKRFFLDISKPVSCGWCWKPFIWIEAVSAQRHNATEHRVNMKCAPPSVAFRGSLCDIFLSQIITATGAQWTRRLSSERIISSGADIRWYKKAKCFGMEVSAFIDAPPAIVTGRHF